MSLDEPSLGLERRQYYSSSQGPFHSAGNLLTFYGGAGRAGIVDAIARKRGEVRRVVQVHGEHGSGRTFLSLVLADRLKHVCNVIRYEHEQLSVVLLLRHLLIELCPREADLIRVSEVASGIDADTRVHATRCILTQLTRKAPGGKPYCLTVDASVDADDATLALLNEFAAVTRNDSAAMLVVLFRSSDDSHGEARRLACQDADDRFADRPDRPLRYHHRLRRLTLSETGEYLRQQMLLFDFNRRDLFTREMVYFIADRSDGLPGSIDTLVRNAFTLANLEDNENPSMAHLLAAGMPRAAEPVHKVPFLKRHRTAFVAVFGACIVVSSIALMLGSR